MGLTKRIVNIGNTVVILASLASPLRAQQSPSDMLFADGHYLRAQTIVHAAFEKNPNDPHALVNESAIEWAFFHQDTSIALAEKAVALADNSAEAHAQLTNALGVKLMSSTASTMQKIGLARRFRQEAERSLQLNPDNPDSIEDMAQYFWNAPGFLGGDKAKAQQFADHLVQVDPVRGTTLKASFAADEKDTSKRFAAIESIWKQAIASRPDSYSAHIGLSAAYFDEAHDKLSLCEAEAKRALTLDPTRVAAYRQLAVLYATTARWDDLDTTIKQARAAVPDDLSPQYQVARIILVNNVATQLSRAEQYLRAYLLQPAEGQEPPLAAAHWRLGLVLEKQGRKPEAIQEIQTAVNQDSSLEGAKKDLKRLN
jgi:tetratricopeptide (TPR) repeat protein